MQLKSVSWAQLKYDGNLRTALKVDESLKYAASLRADEIDFNNAQGMKPRERRETGEQDLFRSRLDQIIDMKHPLGWTVDWGFLWKVASARSKRMIQATHPQPTRLMASGRSSTTPVIAPPRCCANAGSRTPITNTSAASSFSSTGRCSIARR
jgi:hypothetical protein